MLKMGWRNSAILKIKAKISVSYEKTAKKYPPTSAGG